MHDRWSWHHVRLFQHLSQEQIDEVLQAMPAKNVRQRDYVYRVGDVADELFILRAGTVKVFYITSAGREQIINIAQPSDGFGDLFLEESRVRLLTAQALEDVVVRRLHSDTLTRLIQQSPYLSMHFLRYMAYAERQMVRRTQVLLQPLPEARLAGGSVQSRECASQAWGGRVLDALARNRNPGGYCEYGGPKSKHS